MLQWRKDDTIYPAGDIGGDAQQSGGYSLRFFAVGESDDGLHAIVTVNTYAAIQMPHRFYAETMIEYMICTDLDDPGGTEVSSQIEYEESIYDYPTIAEADAAARELLSRWTVDDIGWDGRTAF